MIHEVQQTGKTNLWWVLGLGPDQKDDKDTGDVAFELKASQSYTSMLYWWNFTQLYVFAEWAFR